MKILIVDDQRSARHILSAMLKKHGFDDILEAENLDTARRVLKESTIDVALIDLHLRGDLQNRDGLSLVREIGKQSAVTPIVVTAFNEMSDIRAAMRYGAYDYILKDELCEELVIPILEGIRSRHRLEQEIHALRASKGGSTFPPGFIGDAPCIRTLKNMIRKVSASDRPVLVTGPTGSGKELVVQAIHALGPHPESPLLDVNCGAIPNELIESHLFGHEKGSFTGAHSKKDGYLNAVKNGTLFLDEVAELPFALQSKLLRVLETSKYKRIGSSVDMSFDGRVVAATHADLEKRVRNGQFREDLFYRLNVLTIRVPSLDERVEDISDLVAHFLKQQPKKMKFSKESIQLLCAKTWPGNVRELRNLVDRIAVFCDAEVIDPSDIKMILDGMGADTSSNILSQMADKLIRMEFPDKLRTMERALIESAMTLTNNNKSAAARLLGIHRKSLERRV